MTQPILQAIALEKIYPSLSPNTPGVQLFRGLNLSVAAGEMVAIVGESGAGKSSLLHLLAAMDTPTSGQVLCDTTSGATNVSTLTLPQAADYRNRDIGYVWQFHYLLPEFTAAENVAMPLLARGVARQEALKRSQDWLKRVELGPRIHHRSGELSGGEQQRVSIARALVTNPKVLLADEPTGNLDAVNAERVFTLLQSLHREHALASVLVTHNLAFADRCDRVLRLTNGQLVPA